MDFLKKARAQVKERLPELQNAAKLAQQQAHQLYKASTLSGSTQYADHGTPQPGLPLYPHHSQQQLQYPPQPQVAQQSYHPPPPPGPQLASYHSPTGTQYEHPQQSMSPQQQWQEQFPAPQQFQVPGWHSQQHNLSQQDRIKPSSYDTHGRQAWHKQSWSASTCAAPESSLTDAVQFYVMPSHVLNQPGQDLIAEITLPVCSLCFDSKIRRYPGLAAFFKPLEREPAVPESDAPDVSYRELVCCWRLPRTRQIFYEQCVPQNSITPLSQFARRTCDFSRPCGGKNLITNDTVNYISSAIDDLGVCEPCFEFYLAHSEFKQYFQRHEYGNEYQYYCDLGLNGYISRSLLTELDSHQPDFERFAERARRRMEMPPCPGDRNSFVHTPGDVFVYSAVDGKTGNFCEGCYHDQVLHTSLAPVFSSYNKLSEEQKRTVPCDLGMPVSKLAMKIATQKGNYDLWVRPVSLVNQLPPCVGLEGVDEETLQDVKQLEPWYQYREHPSIEICPNCYVRTVELLGAGPMFAPIVRPLRNGVVRLCYLTASEKPNANVDDCLEFENTLAWRGRMVRNTLSHGFVGKGNFIAFQYLAKHLAAGAPPCGSNLRAYKPAAGRKYLGRFAESADPSQDFTLVICEECYDICAKDTRLGGFLGTDMTHATLPFTTGFVCNTYSTQAKLLLKEACQRDDWSRFKQYWIRREATRARYEAASAKMQQQQDVQNQLDSQTSTDLDIAQQMGAINLMQQLNANTNATIMGIGGSVSSAAGSFGTYNFGGYSSGYYSSTAARPSYSARNMPGVTFESYTSTGITGQDTANMRELYRQVESEWKQIE